MSSGYDPKVESRTSASHETKAPGTPAREDAELLAATAFLPKVPQPCWVYPRNQLMLDLATLRQEDPRARVVGGTSGWSLLARRDEAIYVFAWGCSHN